MTEEWPWGGENEQRLSLIGFCSLVDFRCPAWRGNPNV
jgi:hypothetical protein